MADLLIELYSEEIPARMQLAAEEGLKKLFNDYFTKHKISFSSIGVLSTPMRITIYTTGLNTIIQAQNLEVKGPQISSPSEILDKFCTSHNIQPSDLKTSQDCYYYIKHIPEKKASDILLDILPKIFNEYTWPKSMHWGTETISWVRPLRNILCLFDDYILPVQYGKLIANNLTYGHKFMAYTPMEVKNFADYQAKLANAKVILSRKNRKDMIEPAILSICKKNNLQEKVDSVLLEEVIGLVEYPNVLYGSIPQEFLSLPSEILVIAMRTHQKYFTTKKASGGIADKFIFVSNITTDHDAHIIEGNERVLHARLSDATYFYEQDMKRTLESRINDLSRVSFHQKLGTLKDKTDRLVKICDLLYGSEKFVQDLKKAALLCKADVTTEIVEEFPELQGIIGSIYALSCDKVSQDIADAIEAHYFPTGVVDSALRYKPLPARLSVIDKMDSLVGLFMAGEKSTGSKDPYALRRLAIGIIVTIIDAKLNIDLAKLIDYIEFLYLNKFNELKSCKTEILSFIEDRLKVFCKNNYDHKIVEAVVNFDYTTDLCAIMEKIKYVDEFVKTDDGQLVIATHKRIKNIMPQNFAPTEINAELFVEYEGKLYDTISNFAPETLLSSNSHDKIHAELTEISSVIADLFDNVLIDDGDNAKKQNRLSLLALVTAKFDKYINFNVL